MTDLSERPDPQLMLDLMMRALRLRDQEQNALAAELLTRFGTRPVHRLVLVALGADNRPDHRIRALEVLARINPPYGSEVGDLAALLHTGNKSVRQAARKLLAPYGMLFGLPGIPTVCPRQ